MDEHVIETVIYKLQDGVSEEHFLQAAREATNFMTSTPGFIRRRLSCGEDGTWYEHVEWASMANAKAAAEAIDKDERARAFMSVIDGPSVRINHSELKISVG
jgi:hypothetical protein